MYDISILEIRTAILIKAMGCHGTKFGGKCLLLMRAKMGKPLVYTRKINLYLSYITLPNFNTCTLNLMEKEVPVLDNSEINSLSSFASSFPSSLACLKNNSRNAFLGWDISIFVHVEVKKR